MSVNATDSISIGEWNALRAGISERGGSPPGAVAAADEVSAAFVSGLRQSVASLCGSFVNEDTAAAWSLSAILEHLALGEGSPPTWTDLSLVAGSPIRAVHFNELAAVVKELRWQAVIAHQDTTGWLKEHAGDLTPEAAYANSKDAEPAAFASRCVGHDVHSHEGGSYHAERFRVSLVFDSSGIPDGASVGAARLWIQQVAEPWSGRSFNVKVYGKSDASWPTGTYRGQTPADGESALVTLAGSDVNKLGLSYLLLTCDREEADDQPGLEDDEFSILNYIPIKLLWRREDYSFK